MSLEKVIEILRFSLRMEPTRVVLIQNLTGMERDLTPSEANVWADVCQGLKVPNAICNLPESTPAYF